MTTQSKGDPLGLTPQQRQQSDRNAFYEYSFARMRHGIQILYSLPEGALVRCGMLGCTIRHPVEAFR